MSSNLSRNGFTLVEIMIVVAIIGLLAAIAVPNFVRARESARSSACINNLRLIDASKEQYALENNVAHGAATTSDNLTPYLKAGTFPQCPATSAAYTTNTIGAYPSCGLSGASSGQTPLSHRLT